MNKILTVVVPTYNMDHYLRRCLNSLIIDNNKRDMLEVLIINDGSKDSSSLIAHEYYNKYPNIFVVVDKKNENYGSCINRGLKDAKGKYFRILDADDEFFSKELASLIDQLSSIDVDMVVTNYSYIYDNIDLIKYVKAVNISYGISYSNYDFSINNEELLSMHGITYRTTLLKKISLSLDIGVSYTDLEYVYFPQKFIKTIIFYNIMLYKYHIGREGQTIDSKIQIKNLKSFYVVSQRLLDDYIQDYNTKNKTVKNNQIITMNKIIYATFRNTLMFTKKNIDNDKILHNMYYKIVKYDKDILWLKKNKLKPVVKLWNVTGIYFSSLFPLVKLYRTIKSIL